MKTHLAVILFAMTLLLGCQDKNGSGLVVSSPLLAVGGSPSGVVDTEQSTCYDHFNRIGCRSSGSAFHGQDAQYAGRQAAYRDNGDGTISDLNTGLMWQKTPGGKMTYDQAVAKASSFNLAGYTDWRLPTIKELYSLILFSGVDVSSFTSSSGAIPFINTDYFDFEYGDVSAGERIIDSQYLSSTRYVGYSRRFGELVFGVNFADGRIKGYPLRRKTFVVLYVRGSSSYGVNRFINNGDGTVNDLSTGLTWQQADDGVGRNWQESLAYCENLSLAGSSGWRLPNAKELQSIVDYTSDYPALDTSVFTQSDPAGWFWSSTTHAGRNGSFAAYVCFGPCTADDGSDVHGAGAQRSDPKTGNPDDYPNGLGPQGDCIRIYNFVRMVRDAS